MAESVYLETSVVSALFDKRTDPVCQVQHQQTQQWYDEQRQHYDLYASAAVLEELRGGQYDHQEEAVSFAQSLTLLPLDDEVRGVARVYVDRLIMPHSSMGDALHLAVASVHRLEYLVTWNCRHLANPNKIRQITGINRRLALLTPIIVTPAMLFWEDAQ